MERMVAQTMKTRQHHPALHTILNMAGYVDETCPCGHTTNAFAAILGVCSGAVTRFPAILRIAQQGGAQPSRLRFRLRRTSPASRVVGKTIGALRGLAEDEDCEATKLGDNAITKKPHVKPRIFKKVSS